MIAENFSIAMASIKSILDVELQESSKSYQKGAQSCRAVEAAARLMQVIAS